MFGGGFSSEVPRGEEEGEISTLQVELSSCRSIRSTYPVYSSLLKLLKKTKESNIYCIFFRKALSLRDERL